MLENDLGTRIKRTGAAGWKITLAGFVDAAIAILLEFILIYYRQPSFIYKWIANINTSLLALIILIIYRSIFIMFFDRSLGMMVFRLIFLDHEESKLNFIEKFCAG